MEFSARCTGREHCVGCKEKVNMYANIKDGILGFMNKKGDTLFGGVEYYPSIDVPYDIPKGKDIAFLTCIYMTDSIFDYKSAPLKALNEHLSKEYKKIVAIANEEWDFPNGDLAFFMKHGFYDEGIVYEDTYCKLHLVSKYLS